MGVSKSLVKLTVSSVVNILVLIQSYRNRGQELPSLCDSNQKMPAQTVLFIHFLQA